jgi:pimeloyl-ACP methyl ester carboxylesterase
MPWCTLPALELFYADKGTGEPVLFLNGLSGDHLYWSAQLRAFSRKFHALAPDNRDVGQTRHPSQPYAIADLADDAAGLLGRLNLPPAHVIGLSMGGMIAQELALRAPQRVRSLVLADTLGRSDEWFRGTLTTFEKIRRTVADTPAFFDAIMPWWVSWRYFEGSERITWLRWLLQQNPHPQPLEGFLRQLDAMSRFDALDRVADIRCPVLILAGEDDCICPVRYSERLRDRIPGARLAVLPQVGHAPPIENAALFQQQVTEFLASLPPLGRQVPPPTGLSA